MSCDPGPARPPAARAGLVAAFVFVALGGCTDDSVTFDDRDQATPPPGTSAGFLGYASGDSDAGLTVCGNCHVGTDADWSATAHAGAWATLEESGHAQDFCRECHTVNQRGNAVTGPAGFDENPVEAYHDVQCESCHGPGLDHVELPDVERPLPSIAASTDATDGCGECHQGTHHAFAEEWEQSGHATPVGRVIDIGAADPIEGAACIGCHTGQGALARFGVRADYAEANDPIADHLGITCAVCHDPHEATIAGQLRFPIDDPSRDVNLCIQCHDRRAEPESASETLRGPHAPEGPLLLGEGAGWFPPGFEPDAEIIRGTHGSEANPRTCATCHVERFEVSDAATGEFTFQATGHLFTAIPCVDGDGVPVPGDCDVAVRRFDACATSGCHSDADQARTTYTTVKNDVDSLVAVVDSLIALPGPADEFDRDDGVFTTADGAWFNARLGELPGTSTHNPFLIERLLTATIEALETEYALAELSP
ncbi:MAG: multiheme c-type cytochrome [Gemmatimonadota bacterium]